MKKSLLALAILLSGVLFATPATAHVTVNPKTAEKGAYAKLAFRVPNEKATASTVKLEVTFPADRPFSSVSVQPHAGWTATVDKSKLATPIDNHGRQTTEAVSKITWTADAPATSAIKAGEFDEFNVSVGPLPTDTGTLEFKALQTYSDGDVVRWIESPAPAGQPAPERPAPILTLTDPAPTNPVAATPAATDVATESDVSGVRNLAIASLVVAILSLTSLIGVVARRKGQ